MYYIGIDLGTSAAKFMLVTEKGELLHVVSKEYPLYFPKPGWSEQHAKDWWNACLIGMKELLEGFDASKVAGIGVAGQMHGLVVLDENDVVIRPVILWNDGRTEKEVAYLNEEIGVEKIASYTGNMAFAGFTAPKLLWMKKNEPENFARISKMMLPKDYINYCLTGVHACDYSDASGMLLLDVEKKAWSKEMLNICGILETQMPKLFESYEVIGTIKAELANFFGLSSNVRVVAGAGDNAAAAVGTETVGDGGCNISLGTSGTLFVSSETFHLPSTQALHAFAHADGGYHLMGCMLSAASCNKWFCEEILKTNQFAEEQEAINEDKLGENHVYFLPYLMGERSPINDTNARGVFFGMTMDTNRADMMQAVLEGVAFAMRDSLEIARSLGLEIKSSKLCGGGSKSPLWRTLFANILGIPLEILKVEQGPGYGAAMLAMVGCGAYKTVHEAADALVQTETVIEPNLQLVEKYEKKYQCWKQIYPACKELFGKLNAEEETSN